MSRKKEYLVVIPIVIGMALALWALSIPLEGEIKTAEEKCDIAKDKAECLILPPPPEPGELTEVGEFKKSFLETLSKKSMIQDALTSSNVEYSKMSPTKLKTFMETKELEWTTSDIPTPFMLSIINNDVADFLRENLEIQSEKFGNVTFGEHILTNSFGANVAVTVRTDNFDQSEDDWWQRVQETGLLIRRCVWDDSAKMESEDIVIKIFDEKGRFVGILNSATPCDVIKDKSPDIETAIEPVSMENITPRGHHKISLLKELLNDPVIQEVLRDSNEEFTAKKDLDMLKLKEITDWPKPSQEEMTPLQISILNNKVSNILGDNIFIEDETFGPILFAEHILTNKYGANVASTDRTYNYIQTPEKWWQLAVENGILIRQCGHDQSIDMFSEDIIISVKNEQGKFVGVLNTATPCDVIDQKNPLFEGDSN